MGQSDLGYNYRIVRAKSADALVVLVNNCMEAGFLPQGGACMAQVAEPCTDEHGLPAVAMVYEYFQAMVFVGEDE